MDELLQKHRTFVISVAAGGLVFLLALLLRGCAVYDKDLGLSRATVLRKSEELTKEPVPDERYLRDADRVVEAADARVADLARRIGRTSGGEALWEECIADVLRVIGKDTPERRKDIMERARRLPSAAFSLLLEEARTVFSERAAAAEVEVVPQELGFEQVQEANFARSLAAMAAMARVVDRAISLGVQRVETIAVGSSQAASGGTEEDPFLRSQLIRFRFSGEPGVLAELVKSVNDVDAGGRRLVLDDVQQLGRPVTTRASASGSVEFTVRVILVNLEAREEVAE